MSDEEWGGMGDDGYDIHEFDPGSRNPGRCAECGRPEDDPEHI
jgi:hypothetical protein